MTNKNWRVIFLQLCIDSNAEAEFSPTECHYTEQLYAIMRDKGNAEARRYAAACGGRCLQLWRAYQEAMK